MNKKTLTERDICTKFITPAIVQAGWDINTQVREEVFFTDGRVIVRGKVHTRGQRKRADYILYHQPNLPLAVIEAKDNKHALGAGMQQALRYAEILDIPFVFTSNGDAFLFHDRTGQAERPEQVLGLDAFPSPSELWERYRRWKGLDAEHERIVTHPYYDDGSGRTPRYYQTVAINRCVEAVARGQKRILLVMATGTGKTYTAFQILWRLKRAGVAKRILFLADRNILVDQTMQQDFKPFGPTMTKVKNRTVNKAYEVYLALYQALSGTEEEANIYREFSPDFFDLIVVDECHRGSAREDSAWREILEYFEPAVQIGLTATPRETREVSNIDYFGEPLYTYSLKQGIDDGFLAPYKVVRVDLDRDLLGWRPTKGMKDDLGQEIEDIEYTGADMDRRLVLNERTRRVAAKISEFLRATDPYAKTIVFCEDIDHASRMRTALVNANPDRIAENPNFIVQITGDNDEGKRQLDDFIAPYERYPVIATTSKLLTTGVDTKTVRFIVLDQHIQSMTEFKQIIGRGTRIHEDTGKLYFTILDFKRATKLFADPDFDGDPVAVFEPQGGESVVPPDEVNEETDTGGGALPAGGEDETPGRTRYVVSGVPVEVIAERVQYYGKDGKLITESLKDFTRQTIRQQYASLDSFLNRWTSAERKRVLVDELAEVGVLLEALEELNPAELDPFDLICHIAFDRPPLTRRERAANVRKRDIFTRYAGQARAVLDALLDKYADEGIEHIEAMEVLRVQPFNELGTPVELVKSFGGPRGYLEALRELEAELYRDSG